MQANCKASCSFCSGSAVQASAASVPPDDITPELELPDDETDMDAESVDADDEDGDEEEDILAEDEHEQPTEDDVKKEDESFDMSFEGWVRHNFMQPRLCTHSEDGVPRQCHIGWGTDGSDPIWRASPGHKTFSTGPGKPRCWLWNASMPPLKRPLANAVSGRVMRLV